MNTELIPASSAELIVAQLADSAPGVLKAALRGDVQGRFFLCGVRLRLPNAHVIDVQV